MSDITPSPYLAIIKDAVGDLIRITEAMAKLKTEEAELIVAKALVYATKPPIVYEGKDVSEIIESNMCGGIYWRKE